MPIAIVGFGCRFPGDVTDGEKLWQMLVEKRSARTEVPPDRFNIDAFYNPDGDRFGTVSLPSPLWTVPADTTSSATIVVDTTSPKMSRSSMRRSSQYHRPKLWPWIPCSGYCSK